MKAYVLQHVHELANGREDVKLIGVYSSREIALATKARLSSMPGFADAVSGFHVDAYQLDEDHWIEGYAEALSKKKTAM